MENRIRTILKDKGLRMSDLASRVGMSQSNLVASLRNNPRLSTLEDICQALAIEMNELFGGNANKGEGLIVLEGKTYSITKPSLNTLQLPTYTDYSVLRKDVKKFIKDRISAQNEGALCGLVEDFEFFNLYYDRDDFGGGNEVIYEKFILTICFGNKQLWVRQYDLYEFSLNGDEKWDISMITAEIVNDIEGYVLSDLNSGT